jgi:hypothetical protein
MFRSSAVCRRHDCLDRSKQTQSSPTCRTIRFLAWVRYRLHAIITGKLCDLHLPPGNMRQVIRSDACHRLSQPPVQHVHQSALFISQFPETTNAVRCIDPPSLQRAYICLSCTQPRLSVCLVQLCFAVPSATVCSSFAHLPCRSTWLTFSVEGIYIKFDLHCVYPVSRSNSPYRLHPD